MLEDNYRRITAEIRSMNPDCLLVAVTKERSIGEIRELIKLGQRDFGESRLQELETKAIELENEMKEGLVKWHFIGHLQGNKAKDAVRLCEWIHSIDSLRIAEKINKAAKGMGKVQKALIEVNISGEVAKYGAKPEDAESLLSEIRESGFQNLDVKGFMGIAPFTSGTARQRNCFRILAEIARKANLKELSMGMSGDYKIALSESATMVRIGSALFEGKKI